MSTISCETNAGTRMVISYREFVYNMMEYFGTVEETANFVNLWKVFGIDLTNDVTRGNAMQNINILEQMFNLHKMNIIQKVNDTMQQIAYQYNQPPCETEEEVRYNLEHSILKYYDDDPRKGLEFIQTMQAIGLPHIYIKIMTALRCCNTALLTMLGFNDFGVLKQIKMIKEKLNEL